METGGLQGFLGDVGAAYKQVKREQKSNDIIDFIGNNWKLFVPRRSDIALALSQLGSQTVWSVDALCDLLGIPNFVYFKRSPVVDIGGALLDFGKSKLYELFSKCTAAQPSHEAVMFVVAGKKSLCITNMQTHFETTNYDFRYWDDTMEIHVFKAQDAALRLPNLFNPKENTNE